jgi:hypothetical protein
MVSAASPLTKANAYVSHTHGNTLAYYMGISTQDDHTLALCLRLGHAWICASLLISLSVILSSWNTPSIEFLKDL